MRRALGIRRSWRQKFAPFVLLGVVTIPAIVNVGIGYVTRDRSSSDRHPDHHLPRLRRRVVGPAAVRGARRARRHVPRPTAARAAADVRPAAHRRRLRGGEGRRDRDDPVRVLVPAPGRAVRRQHARQRQRARLLHRPPRCPVEGPVAVAAAGHLLRGDRRRDRVAHRSPDRRRRRGHRLVPRHLDLVGHHRRRHRSTARLDRRRSSTFSRCRCTCAISCSSDTSTPSLRSRGRRTAGCSRSPRTSPCLLVGVGVLLRRYRWVER